MRHLCLLCALSWLCAVSARADGYERTIDEAITEFGAGHFAEAHELFLVAHRQQPNARTLRGLGVTEFELRQYPEAVTYLEQALESETKPLTGELRERTQELLMRARTFVGTVRVLLTPANATIEVDGEPRASTPALTLGIGRHVLRFQAEGRSPTSRTVDLHGGQALTLTVELPPAISALAANTVAESPRSDERNEKRRRRWIWSTVAIAAAAGVATALVLTLRPEPRVHSEAGDLGLITRALEMP